MKDIRSGDNSSIAMSLTFERGESLKDSNSCRMTTRNYPKTFSASIMLFDVVGQTKTKAAASEINDL